MTGAGVEWWLEVDGARLYARAWLPRATPRATVFIVHGLGEHSGRYATVTDVMTASGFTVVVHDLRGHGRSSGPRGHATSVRQLAADLDVVLADAPARVGEMPRIIYGHSLGGAVVLIHAVRGRDTATPRIVTGPAIRPTFAPPAWKVTFGRMVRRLAPSLSLNSGLDPGGLSHDAEVVRAYRADPLVHARVSAALGIDLIDLGDGLLDRAEDLRSPTLVVHGSSDPITSALASRQFAARAGPACAFHDVPGALHEVHHESTWPDTWRVMSEWLEARLALAAVAANRR